MEGEIFPGFIHFVNLFNNFIQKVHRTKESSVSISQKYMVISTDYYDPPL